MSELPYPDKLHYDAATGWLMLGDPASAMIELGRLSPATRNCPCVLEVEWGVHAEQRDWTAAAATAQRLVESAPENTFGWIHRAYAARRQPQGGLNLAWQLLYPALARFPANPTIAYNLACYAAQLGRPEEAWLLLQKAIGPGQEAAKFLCLALVDEDLKPLWPRIKAMPLLRGECES